MNCVKDGGRPPAIVVQAEVANHPLLLRLRDAVVSELGKGRRRSQSGVSRRVERK